jgi:hypothetical protein
MSAPREHPCAACDGSGWRSQGAEAAASCRTDLLGSLACPICLGSGRVSDVMPQRDHEVDKETVCVNSVA